MVTHRITSDEVYAVLLNEISSGRYRFGETLVTRDLSARLAASRFQVIGALGTLQAQGFVAIVPQVGCAVVRPSLATIADFFVMVGRVEAMLAEFAARRRPDAELFRLDEITAQLEAIARHGGATAGYGEVGEIFRNLVHRWSASPEIVAEQTVVLARSAFYLSQLDDLPAMDRQAFTLHHSVVAAIRNRQGDSARRATESFFSHYSRAILRQMQCSEAASAPDQSVVGTAR